MNDIEPEFIGSAEAAAILDRDKRTISRYASSGLLPIAHKVPGGCAGINLFRRADVLALKSERDSKASA